MAMKQDIAAQVAQVLELAAQCAAVGTSDRYAILNDELQALESSTELALQPHVDRKALLGKLEKGAPLTQDEVSMLRRLIVGDADYYLKYDDDFARSKDELHKILDAIRKLQSRALDPDAMMHLSVLCREACSLLVPTIYYLTQKERVGRFEAAMQGPMTRAAGRVLADVIGGMAAR
jgi:hypothetical protein